MGACARRLRFGLRRLLAWIVRIAGIRMAQWRPRQEKTRNVRERGRMFSKQVERAGAELNRSLDAEVRLAAPEASLLFIQIGAYDHIGQAGLILQQQEECVPFRRPRALPAVTTRPAVLN